MPLFPDRVVHPALAGAALNGLQMEPLAEMERILALPDRSAREAALLRLESNRRDMVSHFLAMAFAKRLCEATVTKTHESVIAQIPASLVDASKNLARSYIKAARIVAASKKNSDENRYRDGDA